MDTSENQKRIAEAFTAWEHGDVQPFLEIVSDDVVWTVIGSTTISGVFHGKQAFLDGAMKPLFARLAEPIKASVRNVFADGDHVILQWDGQSRSNSGKPYQQTYCWVMRLADGVVVEVAAYLDTELISAMFED